MTMIKELLAGAVLVSSITMAPVVLGGDEEQCMECHEPAEDWEGLTHEDIIAKAYAPDNKRHEDNMGLSAEQMEAIIVKLLGK